MSKTKNIKIGMAGLMTHPFSGPKEQYFFEDSQKIKEISEKLGAEVIIFSKGIYDLRSANDAALEFHRQDVDLVLLQTSSFSGGSFIHPFLDIHSPIALWAIPEGEPTNEGGLPLNSLTAMNLYNSIIKTRTRLRNEPVKWFFGRAKDPDFQKRFESLLRASYAAKNLREARIGLIGGVAPGFDNLIVDPQQLNSKLGTTLLDFDLAQIYSLADRVSDTESINQNYQKLIAQTKKYSSHLEKFFQATARFQTAFEIFFKENDLQAIALSCWPSFQEQRQLAVCTLMGQLNDTGIISSCEGDVPGAVGMLTLHLLSQGKVPTIMDMVTMDSTDNSVLLWHCGPSAPSLADKNGVEMQSLWLYDKDPHGPLGLHNNLRLKPCPATILGFTPDFSQELIIEGRLDNQKPSYSGSSAWMYDLQMHGENLLCTDLIQTIMVSGYQHHYPLVYGNYEKAARDLATLLDIQVIEPQSY